MTIAITGATGQLGRLVVADLLSRGVPADQIVGVVRNPDKAADLGVEVRTANYTDAEAVQAALVGVDRLLLISGSENGRRVEQHRTVIEAAKSAGVGQLVYTSAPRATDTTLILAPEHAATEQLLAESGLATTVLRNNWYNENYLGLLDTARQTGSVTSAAGDGRVASAARADFAAAAAVVLTSDGHAAKTYELGGDTAWTFAEFTEVVAQVLDRDVSYRSVSAGELDAQLSAAGLDAPTRGFLVGLDQNIAEGTLAEVTGELSALIGRPTTTIRDTLEQSVSGPA